MKIRKEVMKFARCMERELRENDYKGGWKHDTMDSLLKRLNQESEEIQTSINRAHNYRLIVHECADVANFAMMIANVAENTK